LSRDPIGEQGGINLYGYAANDPINYTDPEGRQAAVIGGGALVGAGAAGVAAGVVGAGIAGYAVGTLIYPYIEPYLSPIVDSTVQTISGLGNAVFSKPKPGSKPKGCPTGTLPIDEYPGLDHDSIHGIKDGVAAGPQDWTDIAPNGDVITGDSNGNAVNNGKYTDFLP
jgi:uncharacterized protein RhaS with RHS repeats